jgi:hypothetical protein
MQLINLAAQPGHTGLGGKGGQAQGNSAANLANLGRQIGIGENQCRRLARRELLPVQRGAAAAAKAILQRVGILALRTNTLDHKNYLLDLDFVFRDKQGARQAGAANQQAQNRI